MSGTCASADTKALLVEYGKNAKRHDRPIQLTLFELFDSVLKQLEICRTGNNSLTEGIKRLTTENGVMKEDIKRLTIQNGSLEGELSMSKAKVHQLQTELAAERERADSLRVELRGHQLTCLTDNTELQNVTVRRSRIDSTVGRLDTEDKPNKTKSVLKPRVRLLCPNTRRMPSEKRAKREQTTDSEDHDNCDAAGGAQSKTVSARRRSLFPPPLVVTPLSSRFPSLPRRSTSVEPRVTPAQQKSVATQQRLQHFDETPALLNFEFTSTSAATSVCRQQPSQNAFAVANRDMLCASSCASSSAFAASPSAGMSSNYSSSSSVFSADSASLLGPVVTWAKCTNGGGNRSHNPMKASWMAKRTRKGPMLSKPY